MEFSKDLETVGSAGFHNCRRLRRIAIPLKDNLFDDSDDFVFNNCHDLSQVDLIGGIHKTISSLLLESWKNEMTVEIDRINQELPNTSRYSKTEAIQRWIRSVLRTMEHYKLNTRC